MPSDVDLIYDRFKYPVFKIVLNFGFKKEECEDIFHEVMVKICIYANEDKVSLNSNTSFKDIMRLRALILKITRNICIDLKRKQDRHKIYFIDDYFTFFEDENEQDGLNHILAQVRLWCYDDENAESTLIRKESAAALYQKIKDLPHLDYLFLQISGFGYEEIAEIYQVPLGTIKSRLGRLKVKIREILKD